MLPTILKKEHQNPNFEYFNMKKRQIIGLVFTSAIVIISALMYFGTLLMAEEDRHIEIVDLQPSLQDGDIIFQTSTSNQSKAIQLATNSKYSHMGIIYKNDNKFFVYEAVQPVKLTPLKNWINRGNNGHFVIKRLKSSNEILTVEVLKKMKVVGQQFKGKNYDIYFEWSNDRIYCSELVWKMYKEATGLEIGKLEKLSDFDLNSGVVKQIMKKRYGNSIPMNEKVISPASMFNSDKLETIFKN